MGRLAHLKESLPTFPKPCCVVDYSCPDLSGDWAETQGAEVLRITGEQHFHKTQALNLGARRAIEMGADRLCFLDADTLVRPDFEQYANQPFSWIAHPGNPALIGILVTSTESFIKAGGYDEGYVGWGCEDLDLRLRLHLAGSVFRALPEGALASIPHGDDLRTQHYAIKNHWVSRAVNAIRMEKQIRALTGKGPADLDETAKRLMRVT